MGKIDFNALKKQTDNKAVNVVSDAEKALKAEYTKVWGKTNEEIEDIAIEKLVDYKSKSGKRQPFKINKDKVAQIKVSAKDIGIITPLIVRPYGDGYQVLSGHHRLRAGQELKFATLPCVIRNVSDDEAVKYVVDSNIQRIRLLPTEYGNIFTQYMEMKKDLDMSVVEISERFGISRTQLYRYANIVKCTAEIQQMFDDGVFVLNCADTIVKMPEDMQKDLAQWAKDYPSIDAVRLSEFTAQKDNRASSAEEPEEKPEEVNKKEIVTVPKSVKPSDESVASVAPAEGGTPTVRKYKNKIYERLDAKYHLQLDEVELDYITYDLLDGYFSHKEH